MAGWLVAWVVNAVTRPIDPQEQQYIDEQMKKYRQRWRKYEEEHGLLPG